jgi:hypothetical protein
MAEDAAWRLWAQAPDEEGAALLARLYARDMRYRLFTAVIDLAGNPGAQSALGAFCSRHGLDPEDPKKLARFCVLTGRLEQWRALDPDGTLLADGYQWAWESQRMTLLRALADSGDLDVLHLAARARAVPLFKSEDEVQYLARQYADRGDQAGLRELVTSLPLSSAVLVAGLVHLDAIPGGPGDDGLFTLLSRVWPGRFFSVPWCVTLSRCRPLCRGVHGRIADGRRRLQHGRCAPSAVSRTATDGPRWRRVPA